MIELSYNQVIKVFFVLIQLINVVKVDKKVVIINCCTEYVLSTTDDRTGREQGELHTYQILICNKRQNALL